ncbi:MAG: hypothetical protein QOD80_384 [Verrucomicrobiota bacterium]
MGANSKSRKILVLLLSVVALLGVGATAMWAQAIPSDRRNSLPEEEHEKFGDQRAPSPLWATALSPAMVSQAGPFTSYQVNVDASGNNIVGDAANEPSIAVDPTNRNRMAIGWRQFDTIASNFRQAGWGYSNNGGTSWIFPGSLDPNVFKSDPVLASDETGHFFYLNLFASQTDQFTDMWRSLDWGQSWLHLAHATGGDKEWFTIDSTNSIGHGFQYQYFSPYAGSFYGARQFTRSTDGGFTWMDPILIPNSPQYGTADVNASGDLFIGGVNATTNQVWCVRSTTAKRRTGKVSFDQSTAVNLGGNLCYKTGINPEGLGGQIFLAVDRSGTTTNNNVYLLASLLPNGSAPGSGTDVMFVRSNNGGVTFSTPRRINDDPIDHAKWHWFGTLSVAPNGRIDSVWLDTRNATNNTDSQLFYSYSSDGGNTWSANVAVSNSFDPFLGYPNQSKMGDYITMVSDNTGANVAYAATFNGEEDIYYVRVAPTPVPNFSLSINPSSLTVPRAGGVGNYTATVTPSDGFTAPVSLSVSGLPSGAMWNCDPNPVTGSSTLTVTVSSATSAGTYPFTVTGNGGSPAMTHTATATLVKARK